MNKIAYLLDCLADEIEREDKNIAMAIDRVSDHIEKIAFNNSTWLPGRSVRINPVDYKSSFKSEKNEVYICIACRLRANHIIRNCPRCGSLMQKLL